MNKKVVICSDSTTDLNEELTARCQVKILPLGVTLGSKEYTDGVDIDPDFIYNHYETAGELPKTSAVNVGTFTAFFKEQTDAGNAVVFFTISSEMSSTCSNAYIAAQEFEDVYVVDSRNLSTGGGLLVVRAAQMAQAGESAETIAQTCAALAANVDASFVIDNLEYLHKGGRCTMLEAMGANLLRLKPCIMVRGGKMGVGRKYRGQFAAVLEKYIADMLANPSDIDDNLVFITHAGCDEAIVHQCVEQVKKTGLFREVQVTRAGCTISSHCGRNTLGVLFVRKTPVM